MAGMVKGTNFIFTQSIGEDPELIQLQSDASLKAFKPRGDYSVWAEKCLKKQL